MPEITSKYSSRVHYTKQGSGTALVLIHGFPLNGTIWDGIAGSLAEHFTVIVPDLPGSGESAIDNATSIDDMARIIAEILEHEKADKALLAGHSMGGYVSCAFAALYPEKVLGISLVHATPGADDEERKQVRKRAIDIIGKGGKDALITQLTGNLFSDIFKQKQQRIVQELKIATLKVSGESLINFYTAMMNRSDRSSMLAGAKYPIHWVAGCDDTIIPANKMISMCYTSNINFLSLYKDCGHMAMLESPECLTSDLINFGTYCESRLLKTEIT